MHQNRITRSVRNQHVLPTCLADRLQNGHLSLLLSMFGILLVTLWAYWPTLVDLFYQWKTNENYSAGQLVPFVAVFLVWRERKQLRDCKPAPCWLGGVVLLLLAHVARISGLLLARGSADRYSLVLSIAGLVLLVAGREVFRRVFWILMFLLLMVPLPGRVHNLISLPMQRLATVGSAFLLEAFMQVTRQGNTMVLNGSTPVGVAEACSGLRMLTAFIIVAAFIAYMIKRPRWQKAVLLASSIPVAIACNIIRIVATAAVMLLVSAEAADTFFHDFAGVVMMPAAVLLMFGELWLMDRITIDETETQTIHASRRSSRVVEKAGRGRRQCESA